MSAAEELRAAARLMRERAEAATCSCGGPVCSKPDHWYGVEELAQSIYGADGGGMSDPAPHIASWHPAVALAVADWLEDLGTRAEEIADTLLGSSDELRQRVIAANVPGYQHALTVARTYLGAT